MSKIVTYCGESLADMTHEQLIGLISDLVAENSRLRDDIHQRSVTHVKDLARIAKQKRRLFWLF